MNPDRGRAGLRSTHDGPDKRRQSTQVDRYKRARRRRCRAARPSPSRSVVTPTAVPGAMRRCASAGRRPCGVSRPGPLPWPLPRFLPPAVAPATGPRLFPGGSGVGPFGPRLGLARLGTGFGRVWRRGLVRVRALPIRLAGRRSGLRLRISGLVAAARLLVHGCRAAAPLRSMARRMASLRPAGQISARPSTSGHRCCCGRRSRRVAAADTSLPASSVASSTIDSYAVERRVGRVRVARRGWRRCLGEAILEASQLGQGARGGGGRQGQRLGPDTGAIQAGRPAVPPRPNPTPSARVRPAASSAAGGTRARVERPRRSAGKLEPSSARPRMRPGAGVAAWRGRRPSPARASGVVAGSGDRRASAYASRRRASSSSARFLDRSSRRPSGPVGPLNAIPVPVARASGSRSRAGAARRRSPGTGVRGSFLPASHHLGRLAGGEAGEEAERDGVALVVGQRRRAAPTSSSSWRITATSSGPGVR